MQEEGGGLRVKVAVAAYGGDIVMSRLPSISAPGVIIMHRPARSNFLISPTVVTLISVGRTHHHTHHTSQPQVQGVTGTFLCWNLHLPYIGEMIWDK